MGVLKYLIFILSFNVYAGDAFFNTSIGTVESETYISSLQVQKNINLYKNRFNLTLGLSSTYTLSSYNYSNSNNHISNSLFSGLELNIWKKHINKEVIKTYFVKNDKIFLKKKYTNKNLNENNGFYIGYNYHWNNFYTGQTSIGNEYSLFYEMQTMYFSKKWRFGIKSQSISNNNTITYDLKQLFLGVSFD